MDQLEELDLHCGCQDLDLFRKRVPDLRNLLKTVRTDFQGVPWEGRQDPIPPAQGAGMYDCVSRVCVRVTIL